MKILYLSACAQLGGAEKSLLDILASIRAAKPDWQLHLVASGDGPLISESRALGVVTTVVPFPRSLSRIGDSGVGGTAGGQKSRLSLAVELLTASPAVLAYARRLRRAINDFAPDIVHSNGFKMHLLGLRAKPRCVPIIWHIHDYVSARPLMASLLRHCSSQCALAVANSRSVAADVRAVCGSRLPVETVYNGVDLEVFSPAGFILDLDAMSGLRRAAPETVRVGMLATMARWKGHETFLRAMARIPDNFPVRGYVLGGALYQTNGSQHSLAQLVMLARRLGVSRRIGFTGFVDQPAGAMRALDIIVHASTQPEPFGLVIAEGMACGRAVIVSASGGAVELISAGANALSHRPGDDEMLARRIIQLATNERLRFNLGQAARSTAEARFNRDRLATEFIPIYHAVKAAGKSVVQNTGALLTSDL